MSDFISARKVEHDFAIYYVYDFRFRDDIESFKDELWSSEELKQDEIVIAYVDWLKTLPIKNEEKLWQELKRIEKEDLSKKGTTFSWTGDR